MTSDATEREISALLRASLDAGDDATTSAQKIASALGERWSNGEFNGPECASQARTIALFCLRAGLVSDSLEWLESLLAQGMTIPWSALAEALWAGSSLPDPREASALWIGCEAQNSTEELLDSVRALAWGESFVVKRAELSSRRALELEERRAQLWDMVRFMRANRLFEQEANALAELRALFPEDPEFALQNQSLQERWAREIIAQGRGARRDSEWEALSADSALSADETAVRETIAEQALARAAENPSRGVDFCLLLHFMEFRPEAIKALGETRSARPDPSRDWLRLELLLLARQFVTAIDEAGRLELVYAAFPDASFAVAYARARALWGLGEKQMAIDLARAIVRVRPTYRSAQSLLLEWSGGDNA